MIAETFAPLVAAAPDTLFRAVVVMVNDDASVLVVGEGQSRRTFVCDRLATGSELVELAPHDAVLCFAPTETTERGVVMGRIGPSHAVPNDATQLHDEFDPTSDEPPDEILIEAKEQLTLRVGQGSITIRADGKILIKGTDLVSHAKRMNRIKGGAVSIN